MMTQAYYQLSAGVVFIKYISEQVARENTDQYTVGFWKIKKLK